MSDSINKSVDLKIGKFTLWNVLNSGIIWIGLDDGEGGGFNEKALERHIQEFYDKHF